jgi:outer membrane autotransporter protein
LVSGELTHRYSVEKSTFTPLVRFDYGYVQVGGYGESGAGSSNLKVNNQTQAATIGSLGVKYQYDLNEVTRLSARAMAGYDFSAKSAALTATDGVGTTFTSYGNNPGNFVLQAGVGFEVQSTDNIRIRVNYDYLGRNGGYSNNMINATVMVPF